MPEAKYAPLGMFLKEKRISAGYTQNEIAKKFKFTTHQFVSNWERGLACPSAALLKKLGRTYKFTVDEMFEVLLPNVLTIVLDEFKEHFENQFPEKNFDELVSENVRNLQMSPNKFDSVTV